MICLQTPSFGWSFQNGRQLNSSIQSYFSDQWTALTSQRVHVVLKTWKCSEWRCLQNEDGVENTLGTIQIIHSLYFSWRIILFWKPRHRARPVEDPKPTITHGMQCSYGHFLMPWQPPLASNFLLRLRRIYRSGIVLCSVHKEAFSKIYITRLYSGYDTSESIFCCRCVLIY